MTDRFGLKETTIEAINSALAQYPQVEKAVLYGSRAKGNYKNGSDIDLCLYGDTQMTLTTLETISRKFDDLLLPYKIDLCIFKDLSNPDLIAHIQRVGIVLYERNNLQ